MTTTTTIRHVADSGERAANSRPVRAAARLGFAARGLVYLIVGYLAVRITTGGNGGQSADREGALQAIADHRSGRGVLVVLAVGVGGYALWRFSDAIWGHAEETGGKRAAKRVGSAAKGLLYLAFCASIISVLAGHRSQQGGQQQKTWTARVLGWPNGQWIVGIVGAAVIAGGLWLIYRGLARKFEKHLEMGRMSHGMHRFTDVVGAAGNAGRGLVFAMVGALLIKAAVDFNPDEAQGVDGTLRTVAGYAYGKVLLVIAALGLVAFGVYSFVEARYRRL